MNPVLNGIDRREFLRAGSLAALETEATLAHACREDPGRLGGETLYNGIQLPSVWPPRRQGITSEPMSVPYLENPPGVIPIDVGRQLFVDDFLIEHCTLPRTIHTARYHPACPLVRPDQPWEQTAPNPCAMVFSDGVWYDRHEHLFKMWYMGGITRSTCYATSRDGLQWQKSALDVRPGTNVVQADGRDSTTIWFDGHADDPKLRYKLFRSHGDRKGWGLSVHVSADGIHWSAPVARSGPCGDRTTVFYNPFRRVWVYSIRSDRRGRTRDYREGPDAIAAAHWQPGEPVPWIGADRLDHRRADLRVEPQLYNLDAVAYESLLLGLFSIWRGQPRDRPKPNEICIGFSRDGFHWYRPFRQAFIPVSERHGDWNWGNVQSAGGCCLVVGEQLYFYVSGRAGIQGTPSSGVCTTGLAILRRDGFASLDAATGEGTVTTRRVTFQGRHLFVNADCTGELRVEILDDRGTPVKPFTLANCVPVRGDKTLHPMQWKDAPDLAAIVRKPVRLRFTLTRGRLYAFWVSTDRSGASHGYIAAGGPGFTGPTDTVGTSGGPRG
jgi:hypothetical protein